ncbi:PREDICTED: tumor suppressor p53-binding protein 1-like, partial [Chlamydotis macqueenii]|uniref:tumor suppressor p53-binding protein 1-like n=1 Tax=Chlamydotis macqueenii TaxID=187382 RepID=UPI000529B077
TGMSQLHFGALELSQSQDFESDFVPNEEGARHQFHPGAAVPSSRLVKNDPKDELHGDSTETVASTEAHTALEGQTEKSERTVQEAEEHTRKQVSVCDPTKSEKSLDSCHEESDILSTQEEMFPENNETGSGCPITRVEEGSSLACTPARSLQLLQLSGQGSLVQESHSIVSSGIVIPPPVAFGSNALVPSSPTEQEQVKEEQMDISIPAEGRELMQKQRGDMLVEMTVPRVPPGPLVLPQASTPVSQSALTFFPGSLPVPSQPEFSHDIFVPTQSPEKNHEEEKAATLTSSSSLRGDLSEPTDCLSRTSTGDSVSQPSESCKLILSASECSGPTNTEVSSGSLNTGQDCETTQVEMISECNASDARLCSVENDNVKLRVDMGDQALSENCEKAQKEDLQTTGKPVMQLVRADIAGDRLSAPTAHREIEPVSESQAAADQSGLPEILSYTQGREAQSEGYAREETSEPEAVPETQCEEQEEKLQVKEKQINEDGSLVNIALSQRLILEREVQCHEDMEVESADGSCKNNKNLSDQAQEVEKIGLESWRKGTSKGCTFGNGQAKSVDRLSFEAALENMPKLSEVLSKPSVGKLLEQHNDLFPKLDVPSEVALCAKNRPGCSELGQTITGDQPPPQEGGVDMLMAQQGNLVPKNVEDAVVTRDLQQEEQMKPQEKATAKSPSPSSGTSFHFTLPREGDVVQPLTSITPPLIGQLKMGPRRHSTPIEPTASDRKDGSSAARAASSSQKTSSVFSRVCEVRREDEVRGHGLSTSPFRGNLFSFPGTQEDADLHKNASGWQYQQHEASGSGGQVLIPQRIQQECHQQPSGAEDGESVETGIVSSQTEEGRRMQKKPSKAVKIEESRERWANTKNKGIQTTRDCLFTPTTVTIATQTSKEVSRQVEVGTSMSGQRPGRQDANVQTEESGEKLVNASGEDTDSLHSQGEEEFNLLHPPKGQVQHRHLRTIREVRTVVTRVITDVYYINGAEVERKVVE